MTASIPPVSNGAPVSTAAPLGKTTDEAAIGRRFEQMLWAQMLSHAGLEKALTLGGGEAASSFSRYVVEAIAKDLAAQHPLGLAPAAATGATDRSGGGDS